jgi:hypothetical protein
MDLEELIDPVYETLRRPKAHKRTRQKVTNIHYPTDSSLLGDGVRVLTRTMKRIVEI